MKEATLEPRPAEIENQDTPVPEKAAKIPEVKLSDGRIALVQKGKGRTAVTATRICDGDQTLFFAALVSILTTIDGVKYPMEYYLDDMGLSDYLSLVAEVGGSFT